MDDQPEPGRRPARGDEPSPLAGEPPNALPPRPVFFGRDWNRVTSALQDPQGHGGAVPPQVSAPQDWDTVIRLVALEELERFWGREERVLEPLLEAIRDADPRVRRAVASALGRTGRSRDPRLVGALKTALRDEDQGVRGAAVAGLLGVAAGTRDPELLSSAVGDVTLTLRDPDWSTRSDAVRLIGRIGDQRAVAPLIVVLQRDEDFRVRAKAATALAEFGDSRAAEVLLTALSDPDPWVCGAAAEGLARLKDIRAVEPLIAALGASPTRGHRLPSRANDWLLSAAKALGDLGDPRAIDVLTAVLKSVGPALREAAAGALGKIGDDRAVRPLIDALQDDEWRVRAKAAEALGVIGDSQAVDPLTALLEAETDKNVRWAAAKALTKIDDPRAAKAVQALPYALRSVMYFDVPPPDPIDDRRKTVP